MRNFLTALLMACAVLVAHPGGALADEAPTPAPTSAPAAATTAPTAPFTVDAARIDTGDTAWLLVSTALVLFMTIPGLALFYGGMVRKKNVLATIMQSFAITCIVTVLWTALGYSLAFTPGNGFIGGFSRVFLNGMDYIQNGKSATLTVSHLAPTIPESVYFAYQLTFAIVTPALITGAVADRMKFSSMLAFTALWVIFVYAPIAHMMWEPTGWFARAGILDYAGGVVVHVNAGIAGLVCCLVLGERAGYGREAMPPHNLTLTLAGAGIMWIGWFGFDAGSAFAADGRAGLALITTQIAAACAALAWMFAEWAIAGKPSVLGLASGAAAGLIAVTPASGYTGVLGAIVIGVAGGLACYWAVTWLKHKLKYDDSLDVFGVIGVGGVVGTILTGAFTVKDIGGVDGGILLQTKGTLVTLLYSGAVSYLLLKAIDKIMGLRVTPEEEREGLDLTLHGERVE